MITKKQQVTVVFFFEERLVNHTLKISVEVVKLLKLKLKTTLLHYKTTFFFSLKNTKPLIKIKLIINIK